jgi:ABC-type oligopeptide transport system ATPase subunit
MGPADLLNLFVIGVAIYVGFMKFKHLIIKPKTVMVEDDDYSEDYSDMFPDSYADNIYADEGYNMPVTPVRDWIGWVNQHGEQILIVGGRGSGKTTMARAILNTRGGIYCIITAKHSKGFEGLKCIGVDDDGGYTEANHWLELLRQEYIDRNIAQKHEELTANKLTIILDDYSSIVADSKDKASSEAMMRIARMGRELGMMLIVLSDSDRVKSLGIEGEGASRNNFAVIRLQRNHEGTYQEQYDSKDYIPIDTQDIQKIADYRRSNIHPWTPKRNPDEELSDWLDFDSAMDVHSAMPAMEMPKGTNPQHSIALDRMSLEDAVSMLVGFGVKSQRMLGEILRNNGHKLDQNVLPGLLDKIERIKK